MAKIDRLMVGESLVGEGNEVAHIDLIIGPKPPTVMFNKVTIKGATQAVQMFGPAQRAVALAVADSVEDGTIPMAEADNLFLCVGVFIHWQATDDKKIQDYNYQATREAIQRAVSGSPTAAEVVDKKGTTAHPFAAHL
jgi:5,6,7,8-tetrahydromethanopterin hydro-lyase